MKDTLPVICIKRLSLCMHFAYLSRPLFRFNRISISLHMHLTTYQFFSLKENFMQNSVRSIDFNMLQSSMCWVILWIYHSKSLHSIELTERFIFWIYMDLFYFMLLNMCKFIKEVLLGFYFHFLYRICMYKYCLVTKIFGGHIGIGKDFRTEWR